MFRCHIRRKCKLRPRIQNALAGGTSCWECRPSSKDAYQPQHNSGLRPFSAQQGHHLLLEVMDEVLCSFCLALSSAQIISSCKINLYFCNHRKAVFRANENRIDFEKASNLWNAFDLLWERLLIPVRCSSTDRPTQVIDKNVATLWNLDLVVQRVAWLYIFKCQLTYYNVQSLERFLIFLGKGKKNAERYDSVRKWEVQLQELRVMPSMGSERCKPHLFSFWESKILEKVLMIKNSHGLWLSITRWLTLKKYLVKTLWFFRKYDNELSVALSPDRYIHVSTHARCVSHSLDLEINETVLPAHVVTHVIE